MKGESEKARRKDEKGGQETKEERDEVLKSKRGDMTIGEEA